VPRLRALALLLLPCFALLLFWSRREARSLRELREEVDPHVLLPPPGAIRLVSLGYNELAADLLWVRTLVYYGDGLVKKHGMPDLAQLLAAMNRLDPGFRRPYYWGAHAITFRNNVATDEEYRLSIEVLRRAVIQFPDDWEFAWMLGLRLFLDARSDKPDEVRAFKEEGAHWLERAMRMPHAPGDLASLAATMRTKLGQRERALRELREMIYTTLDPTARQTLLRRYALLSSSDEAAAEIRQEAEAFETAWRRNLPYVPASLYVLLGPHPDPGFRLAEIGQTVQSE
jgi:hypothetical protein